MRFLKGISEKTKVKKEGYREGTNGVVIHIFEGNDTCVERLGIRAIILPITSTIVSMNWDSFRERANKK